MKVVAIEKARFSGKRNFPWKDVEAHLSQLSGTVVEVEETKDEIRLGSHFASEYCGSVYTKKLKGTLEKAKGNASLVILDLIRAATNRRYSDNKESKHDLDANKGWYRYDVSFSLPAVFAGNTTINIFRATLIARINDSGIYLHDLINIKKEDSKPFESDDRTV